MLLRHDFGEQKLFRVYGAFGAEDVAQGVGDELGAVDSGHLASETAQEAIGGEGGEAEGEDSVEGGGGAAALHVP